MIASIRNHRNKQQFRCAFPGNGHGHLRTETRSITAKRTDRIDDRAAGRDKHMHQEMPAVRGGRNILDEQTTRTIVSTGVRKRKI